jgi:transcription termination factor Rho
MSPRSRKTANDSGAAQATDASDAQDVKPRKRGRPRKQEAATEAASGVSGTGTETAAGPNGVPDTTSGEGAAAAAPAVEAPAGGAADEAESREGAGAERAPRERGDGAKKGGRSGGRKGGGNGKSKANQETGDRIGTDDAGAAQTDRGGSDGSRDRSGDEGDQEDRGRSGRGGRNRRGRSSGGRKGGLNFRELQSKIVPELHLLAKEVGLEEYRQMSKDDLALAILERSAESEGLKLVQGYLEISSDGYGFLQESLLQLSSRSVIVSAGLIKQFKLRAGDYILGKARRPRDNERYGTLIRVEAVNGVDPFHAAKRPRFDDLVPTFPEKRITLETAQDELSARVIDLLAPIGRGQRGLIVAPPKAGKTTLLKKIANSVVSNEDDIKVIVLLVDERPEEVTDFRESVSGVEVIASTFDEPPSNHIRVAEFVHERARRIVEEGGHVMILLDSITRLARANNLVTPATGRTLSGGLDSNALHWPKRFLGAARNIRGGGSLSILATALVETGSRMDDVIFEEFKGTGNMELHLSRRLEERRIFPAIDILKSGTRREDLLLGEAILAKMWLLRKVISDMDAAEAMEMLLSRLSRTKSNEEFLATLGQG